jgi:hypothetical protein
VRDRDGEIAKLRREKEDLRRHVELYEEVIRQLTIENDRLKRQVAAGLKVNPRAVRVARNLASRQRSGEVGWAPYAESVVMPNRVRAQGHRVILAG